MFAQMYLYRVPVADPIMKVTANKSKEIVEGFILVLCEVLCNWFDI